VLADEELELDDELEDEEELEDELEDDELLLLEDSCGELVVMDV